MAENLPVNSRPTYKKRRQSLAGDDQPYQVNVWDVGGQKSIRTFWKNYFEQTEGLVWVVDCSDRSRLQICKDEMQQVIFGKFLGKFCLFFAKFRRKKWEIWLNIGEIWRNLA